MEVLLEEEGFAAVRPEVTDSDPLEALAAGGYDLAILDIHGVAGHDLGLLHRVREDARLDGMPILVCSADIQLLRGNAATLSAMPGVACLEKPFRIDALAGALRRPLEGSLEPAPPAGHPDRRAGGELQDWLGRLGRSLHWAVLDAWVPDARPGLLRCAAAWCASAEFEPFCRVTRRTHLPMGGGLPGRIWVSGRPAWVEDVATDLNFPRLPAARRAGLVSAAAAPVLDGSRTVGVLAAYTTMRRPTDAAIAQRLQAAATDAFELFRATAGITSEA
jgi:GAF domain-containing protein